MEYAKIKNIVQSQMKTIDATAEQMIASNLEIQKRSQDWNMCFATMQDTLARINAFGDYLEEEHVVSTLDKLRNDVTKIKLEHESGSREIAETTKAVGTMRKEVNKLLLDTERQERLLKPLVAQ